MEEQIALNLAIYSSKMIAVFGSLLFSLFFCIYFLNLLFILFSFSTLFYLYIIS